VDSEEEFDGEVLTKLMNGLDGVDALGALSLGNCVRCISNRASVLGEYAGGGWGLSAQYRIPLVTLRIGRGLEREGAVLVFVDTSNVLP